MDTNIIEGRGSATGTDTYAVILSIGVSALVTGGIYYIRFANANTGAATLNVNTIGAIAILKQDGTALDAGDINTTNLYILEFDGAAFRVINALGGVINGAGIAPRIARWSDPDTLTSGTWEFSGNTIRPVTNGSDVGDATHRVTNLFMLANGVINYDTAGTLTIARSSTFVMDFSAAGLVRIGGSAASVYPLSVQSTGVNTYIEMLNGAGTNKGAFIGIAGVGADGDSFELFNFQGGSIDFFTDTVASSFVLRMIITASGNVGIGTPAGVAPTASVEVYRITEAASQRFTWAKVGGASIGDTQSVSWRFNNSTPALINFGNITARVETATVGSEKMGLGFNDVMKASRTVGGSDHAMIVGVNVTAQPELALLYVRGTSSTQTNMFRVRAKDDLSTSNIILAENSGATATRFLVRGDGNIGFGTSLFGTNAATVISQALGTAPTTSPADIAQMYVADHNGAGTATFHILNEEGDTIIFLQSPAYSLSNVTTDRVLNANVTNIGELADVLGTLITDLQASGMIG